MDVLTENERALLQKLADAGKPTDLEGAELVVGKALEDRGLVFFVRKGASAIVSPRGRHALLGAPSPTPGKKPPFGFLG